jgi:hypothetical protein
MYLSKSGPHGSISEVTYGNRVSRIFKSSTKNYDNLVVSTSYGTHEWPEFYMLMDSSKNVIIPNENKICNKIVGKPPLNNGRNPQSYGHLQLLRNYDGDNTWSNGADNRDAYGFGLDFRIRFSDPVLDQLGHATGEYYDDEITADGFGSWYLPRWSGNLNLSNNYANGANGQVAPAVYSFYSPSWRNRQYSPDGPLANVSNTNPRFAVVGKLRLQPPNDNATLGFGILHLKNTSLKAPIGGASPPAWRQWWDTHSGRWGMGIFSNSTSIARVSLSVNNNYEFNTVLYQSSRDDWTDTTGYFLPYISVNSSQPPFTSGLPDTLQLTSDSRLWLHIV